MGFNTFKSTKATRRGLRLEPAVIKRVETLKKISLKTTGS